MQYAIWVLLSCSAALHAQPDTLRHELGQLVVSATRLPVAAAKTPPAIRVLDGAYLYDRHPRSLAEGLIGVPGVWMQKTNHAGGSPFVRGLTGNQVLLLYDGIRLNNTTYRYGPNQYFNTVDPFAVGSVEVVPGGGSVLYGSDALGGTINLLTPEIAPTPGDTTRYRGALTGRWRNQGTERTLRGRVELRKRWIGVYGGVSLRSFGDFRAGGELGTLPATGYREAAVDVKAKVRLTPADGLTIAHNTLRQSDVGRYDQVVQRGYARYDYDPQARSLTYLRWEHVAPTAWLEHTELTVARQRSAEVRYLQQRGVAVERRESDRVLTHSITALGRLRLGRRWTATVGAELYHDRVSSAAENKNLESGTLTAERGLYPASATALNRAVFFQPRLVVNRWRLRGGLRYNHFRLRFRDDTFGATDVRPAALVWDAGLARRLGEVAWLEFSVGRAFRAPNVNDLSSFGSFDFGVEVPSPDLLPETGLQYGLALRRATGPTKLRLAVYRNELRSLIVRERSTYRGTDRYDNQEVYTKVNRDRAYLYGGEASVDLQPSERWTLRGGMAYTYGAAGDAPMRRIPPLSGSADAVYRHPDGWYLGSDLNWAAAQRRLSGGDVSDHRIADGGTDGWLTVGLRAGYDWKDKQLVIFAENLTDAAYRMHGSGVDGIGRSVGIEVTVSMP